MPGGFLASTFELGVPKPQKTPVLGFSRHSGAARAVGLAQKRLNNRFFIFKGLAAGADS